MINDKQVNLDEVKAIETASIDLMKFDKSKTKVADAIVTQVPSKYVETEDKMQWVLKVMSETVFSFGEGEEKVEFVASELFNLIQDEKGSLIGFPTGAGSNLMKFMNDLRITKPEEMKTLREVVNAIKGKEALIKCYDRIIDGKKKTYMKFRY